MTESPTETLAATVLQARRDRSLSLNDLSRIADVPEDAVRTLEAGGAVATEHASSIAFALLSIGTTGGAVVTSPGSAVNQEVVEAESGETDAVLAREGRHVVVFGALAAFVVQYLGVRSHAPDVALVVWGFGVCIPLSIAFVPVMGHYVGTGVRLLASRRPGRFRA